MNLFHRRDTEEKRLVAYLTMRNRWSHLSSHQIGFTLYRYPTSVHWGDDFADGFRLVWADAPEAALAHPKAKAAGTELTHLQQWTLAAGWCFVNGGL